MTPIKRLLQHTAVYGLSSILGRLLNYLLVPLYTNVFVPSEYAVVTELYAYVGFLMVFLTFGMETGFFRFANKTENWKEVYSTLQIFITVLALLFLGGVFLFRDQLAVFLEYRGQSHFLIYLAVIVTIDALTALPFARLRFENRPMLFAGIRFFNIGVNIGLNLLLILLIPYLFAQGSLDWENFKTPKLEYIFWSNMIASFVALLLLIPAMMDTGLVFRAKIFRRVFAYSLPLLIMGLAGMINETFDRAILKHLIVVPEGTINPEKYVLHQLGVYGANYKLSIMMTLFIQAFRYAAEPFFFAQAKEKGAEKLYARVMNYFVAFGLFVFLGILFYIDIVKHFINSSYHEGLGVVPILLIANLFLGIVYNLSIWYKLSDRTRIGMWIGLVGATLTIFFNLLLVPKYGYMGAAWTTLVCYSGMALISYLMSRRFYPIPYDMKLLAMLFLGAVSLFAVSVWTKGDNALLNYGLNTVYLLIFTALVAFGFRKDISRIRTKA